MIHAGVIGILLFSTAVYLRGDYPRWAYYLAFTIKALATIAIGEYFLTYEQSGDTILYFSEAVQFNQEYADSFSIYIQALISADIPALATNWHSVFFVKLIAPFVWFTGANYWTTALYLTLVNFILTWTAVTLLVQHYHRKWLIYIAFFAIPSTLAWSGGVFKESVSNGCLFLLIATAVHQLDQPHFSGFRQKDWLSLIGIILCWVILLKIRFYLAGLIVVFVVIAGWLQWFKGSGWVRWSTLFALLIICFFSMQLFHPYLRPERLPLTFYENYQQIHQATGADRAITYSSLNPTYSGLLLSIPVAALTGLFRPMILEFWDWIYFPFQLEKLAMLVLLIWSLRSIKLVKPSSVGWTGIALVILLATALAIVSPNFGSLLRYQSAYTPFLFIIVAFLPLKLIDSTSNQ